MSINSFSSLINFGVKVTQLGPSSYRFQADEVNLDYLHSDQFKVDGRGLRGSIMLVGPLLARLGKGSIPRPEEIKLADVVWIPILKA